MNGGCCSDGAGDSSGQTIILEAGGREAVMREGAYIPHSLDDEMNVLSGGDGKETPSGG